MPCAARELLAGYTAISILFGGALCACANIERTAFNWSSQTYNNGKRLIPLQSATSFVVGSKAEAIQNEKLINHYRFAKLLILCAGRFTI